MAYLAYWENRLRPWYRIEKNTEKIAVQRSEQSERASKRVSGTSKRINEQASDPVLKSGFLVILNHSVPVGVLSTQIALNVRGFGIQWGLIFV